MTGYLTPDAYGEAELVEKRSRFIGQVWHVESEDEARGRIEETKKKRYDARHNCWCYRLRSGTERYGDDGEPQGTAGQPMLNVFQAGEVTDAVCVVTRYFGGVLLGAGGLVRAYSAAAKAALDAAGLQQMAQWQSFTLDCPYSLYERVKRLLDSSGSVIENTDFGASVGIETLLRAELAPAFQKDLSELTAGAVTAMPGEICFRGVKI